MAGDRPPAAGTDYPRTFREFETFFPTERACREHLFRVRWPEGFVCPGCRAASGAWHTARGYLHCRACERETSPTAGTVFEGTRTSLRTWYLAMWLVTSQKHGASALGLQRVLGLGSYQTAWTWLHKLRRAMVRPGRDGLRGDVEVDETYVGGEEEGVRGRQTLKKAIVAIAVERGATVHTDGWGGYNEVEKHGYTRRTTVLAERPDTRQRLAEAPGRVIRRLLPLHPIPKTFAERLLVAGDAGGFTKPTTGGGIFYSLLTASLAAEVLAGGLAAGRLDEAFLAGYERRWQERLGQELRVADWLRSAVTTCTDDEIDALVVALATDDVQGIMRRTARFNWHRELFTLIKPRSSRRKRTMSQREYSRSLVSAAAPSRASVICVDEGQETHADRR